MKADVWCFIILLSPPLKKQQIFTDIPSMITDRQERPLMFDQRSLRKNSILFTMNRERERLFFVLFTITWCYIWAIPFLIDYVTIIIIDSLANQNQSSSEGTLSPPAPVKKSQSAVSLVSLRHGNKYKQTD
jgi:hypothetical protein